MGIPGTAWEEVDPNTIPKDAYQYFAEINGERDLWYKVPLNTNLCYSNPKVLDLMAQDVVRYLTIRPRIDILHIWLADGSNNQCECENCRKALPSDFYIKFLNLVDSYLTEKNIETKIVFLIYVDLLYSSNRKAEQPRPLYHDVCTDHKILYRVLFGGQTDPRYSSLQPQQADYAKESGREYRSLKSLAKIFSATALTSITI